GMVRGRRWRITRSGEALPAGAGADRGVSHDRQAGAGRRCGASAQHYALATAMLPVSTQGGDSLDHRPSGAATAALLKPAVSNARRMTPFAFALSMNRSHTPM